MAADEGLAFLTIAETGVRYRNGSLTPGALVELALERIQSHDPALNAFATVLEEPARAAAGTAERELRAGRDRGPLHGIPIAVKDLAAMAGVPTRFGSDPVFAETPAEDAPLVARLGEAGAIIIGKTNLLEFAYGAVNPKVGQTNNPWDTGRTSGGSSGGSAAAVAAGLCHAAVGTDTGGSIRIPAAYCGIVGLKPTYDLVDTGGLAMLSWSLDHAGPMARSCADAAALLAGMTGKPVQLEPAALGSMRLGVIAGLRDAATVTPGVAAAFGAACDVLRDAGAALDDVTIEGIEHASDAMLSVVLPEASVIHEATIKRHAAAYAEQTRSQFELGFTLPATAYVRAQQFRRFLGAQFLAQLERYDALLSPTVPFEALTEDPAIDDDGGHGESMATAPTNLCGLPSASIFAGLGADGLPAGLQIIGRPHADAQVLSIGAAIEALIPPQVPPRYAV